MTRIPPKKLTLRAFKIENPSLTEPHSGILGLLQQVLTPESIVAQRRMPLNAEDPDRDLLANFTWSTNNSYMFGMMLRIIPADNGGVISEELFNQPTSQWHRLMLVIPIKVSTKVIFILPSITITL